MDYVEEDIEEAINNFEENMFEMCDSMVDVYTSDLTEWLNNRTQNTYYLDEVITEAEDGFSLLAMAQYRAIEEISSMFLSAIRDFFEVN